MDVADAVVAALGAAGVPAAVADRPKNTGTGPFVVIWPEGPVRAAATMADGRGQQTVLLACHCAGLSESATWIVEKKLADAVYGLYGQTVDGQKVGYPIQDWVQPMARDDKESPPLYDLAVQWRLLTTPA